MNSTGWTYERLAESADLARFVCHDHDLDSGLASVTEALEFARGHLAERHPDELEVLDDVD